MKGQELVLLLWLLAGVVKGDGLDVCYIQINSSVESQCLLISHIMNCADLTTALELIKTAAGSCLIEIQHDLPLNGNTEITLDGGDYLALTSLQFTWSNYLKMILPNNSFFIKMNNVHFNTTFTNLIVQGESSNYSAIEFHSLYSNVSVSLQICAFSSGNLTGPVTLFDMMGSLSLNSVIYSEIISTANCGPLVVRNYSKMESWVLTGSNLYSQGNGGLGCIYGSEGSEFYADLLSLSQSYSSGYGGGLYIEGPGKYTFVNQLTQEAWDTVTTSPKRGNVFYAVGFDEFTIANSSLSGPVPLSTLTADEGGEVYLSSSRSGSTVSILHSSIRLASVSYSGGLIYVQNVALLNISSSNFIAGQASSGYGGCVTVDNVHSFICHDTTFQQCLGKKGAAIACFNGSSVVDFHNVTFSDKVADSSIPNEDLYADSLCTSPFWTSGINVDTCSLCNTTVCGKEGDVVGAQAECFCEGPNCSTKTSSSIHTSPDNTDNGMRTTIIITVLTVVCAIMAVVAVGVIGYIVVVRRKQRFNPVDTEIEDDHIQ